MMILGLDMAQKTGWAIACEGKIVESGVQDMTKRRGESNGLLFLRFRKWLDDMVKMNGVEIIAYEAAHFRGGGSTEIGVGLQTRAQEIAAQYGIESAPVHTATLKKWATGSGRADKIDMGAAAALKIGRLPKDDNEADAVLVALWASEEFS